MSVRRLALVVAAAALAAAGPSAATARATDGQAYAAALNYATPALVLTQGQALRFNNLDSLAQHNLISDQPGLFGTALIAGGQSALVDGVAALPPGRYSFHCSLHGWMHGELTIMPAGAGIGPPPPSPGPPPPSPGPPPPSPGPPSPAAPNPADLLPHVAATPLGAAQWPFYGGDLSNSRNGGDSAPSYNEVPTLGPVWSFQSTRGDFTGTPVVADGTVVVGSGGGTVFALDAASGALRWSRDLGLPINGSAAIAHGRVFVPLAAPGHPQVAALSLADGTPLWKTTVDSQKDADVYGSPVVWTPPAAAHSPAGARKPTRRHRRHVRHVRRRHVKPRAHRHRRRAIRRHRGRPSGSASADTVYIGTSALYGELNDPNVRTRGSVVALDAATGAMRWKTYTVPAGHDGGAVWSTPAIDAQTRTLFVGTGNAYHPPAADTTDSLLALDAASGQIVKHLQATAGDVWNGTSEATGGPDYDFGASPMLFAGPNGEKLVGDGQKSGLYWALDSATLRPVWTVRTGPGTPVVGGVLGSTAFDGRRLYGPDTAGGELWGLSTGGGLAWLSSDGGPLGFSAVSAANGVVYTTDMHATLTAREATTGAVLAELPLGAPSWGGVALAGGSIFAVTGTQGSNGWVVAYRPRG